MRAARSPGRITLTFASRAVLVRLAPFCIAIVQALQRSMLSSYVKRLFMLSLNELRVLARRLQNKGHQFRRARGFDRHRQHRKLRPTRRSNIVARLIQDWTRRWMDSSAPKARTKHALPHATGADPQSVGVGSGTLRTQQALSRPAERAHRRALDCVAALHRGLCGYRRRSRHGAARDHGRSSPDGITARGRLS